MYGVYLHISAQRGRAPERHVSGNEALVRGGAHAVIMMVCYRPQKGDECDALLGDEVVPVAGRGVSCMLSKRREGEGGKKTQSPPACLLALHD